MNDRSFEQLVREHLEREYTKGLMVGAQTMAQVVVDKLTKLIADDALTSETINEVIRYCSTCLNKTVNADGTVTSNEEV